MSINHPNQLVEEFKKSGEFDRLRKLLLQEFMDSEGKAALHARVDDIAKQKLGTDPKLQYMPEAGVSREIMQELERFPVVERAVAQVTKLSDPAFAAGMKEAIRKILQDDRIAAGQPLDDALVARGPKRKTAAAQPQQANGNDSDSDSSASSMDIDDESDSE
ncbi:uncharacterized protein BXZ73DRAFT_97090 [Epithele typhae]|uniref:uncharacterized protein n=1 Tax=Epithele typhae TaxID=378194 RepID=UPI002008CC3A|nr:uncharacterized protein BXZ73DRAFT_97090 [Epithele typhae]KAH9943026.1 hypothetical protein BXZ73DRAFT_97090 [Epithele typhae]